MIQRVQTLFLLGVILCAVAALFLPLLDFVDPKGSLGAFSTQMEDGTSSANYQVAAVIILIAVVAGISIFKYANRLTQIKLGTLISALTAGAIALTVFTQDYPFKITFGGWALLAGLVFNFFANWFIRKDEKLVRDSERLR